MGKLGLVSFWGVIVIVSYSVVGRDFMSINACVSYKDLG